MKITLEDVALEIEAIIRQLSPDPTTDSQAEEYTRMAALCRAAQKVIKDAKSFVIREPDRLTYEADLKVLGSSLKAFTKAEQGDAP